MASADEERIRIKAEAMMRRRWPGARIIHELQLEQGGVRIDMAAAGEDILAVAEIKSKKDVLKRMVRQLARSRAVASEVWLCVAPKHEAEIGKLRRYWEAEPGLPRDHLEDRAQVMSGVRVFVERDEDPGAELFPDSHSLATAPILYDPRALAEMLWAGEMRSALGRHFGGAMLPGSNSGLTRDAMKRLLLEHMTGRELRRAVLEQLRNRPFPRADAPASAQEASHGQEAVLRPVLL